MTTQTKLAHISTVRVGDTVVHGGKERTVCKRDLKHSPFMGTTLFGDSYRLGNVLVVKAVTGGRATA